MSLVGYVILLKSGYPTLDRRQTFSHVHALCDWNRLTKKYGLCISFNTLYTVY